MFTKTHEFKKPALGIHTVTFQDGHVIVECRKTDHKGWQITAHHNKIPTITLEKGDKMYLLTVDTWVCVTADDVKQFATAVVEMSKAKFQLEKGIIDSMLP